MIGNPIIGKELVTVLRSRGALALSLCFVVALSLLALFMWPEAGINPLAQLYSRLFFSVLLSGQLVMLALFSPPFAATSITAERETNTWELLYYSLLRPDHILVGKLFGAVAFLLILVLLSLPVGGTCFLLGGVSVREMFLAYLVLVAAGLSFGLIGLTCSALFRTSFGALVATYVSLLVLCGGVHMPMLLVPNLPGAYPALDAVRCLSPFYALVSIPQDALANAARVQTASGTAAQTYFIGTALLCAALTAVLIVRIAMRPNPRPRKRVTVVDEKTPLAVRMMRRVFFIIDPRRRRGSIGDWVNPVFVQDLRARTAGIGNLLRAAFACLIVSILLVIVVAGNWGTSDTDTIRLIAIAFQIGLIALIGPSLTMGAISSEVEGRTYDLLRMTPLRPWTIFIGKFGAAAVLSLMLVLSAIPVFLAVRFIEQVNEPNILKAFFAEPASLLAMLTVTCVTILFALASGLFFSSVCRTTARAGAWAYGLMALVTTGSLIGLVVRERLSDGAARFILAFNPVVTAVGAVSDRQFTEFGHWQRNVWALGSLSLLLIIATIYRLHRSAGAED